MTMMTATIMARVLIRSGSPTGVGLAWGCVSSWSGQRFRIVMTPGSAVIDATLLWPHACKSSVVSVALGTGLATILGFACGFGSVVSPSEIDACASSALRGFADSLPDDGRGFAGTARD